MNTVIKAVASIGVLSLLILIIPFSISLPSDVITFFETNPLQKLYNYANFFFPIGFALKMLIAVWLSKYVSIFWDMLNWIYRKVLG